MHRSTRSCSNGSRTSRSSRTPSDRPTATPSTRFGSWSRTTPAMSPVGRARSRSSRITAPRTSTSQGASSAASTGAPGPISQPSTTSAANHNPGPRADAPVDALAVIDDTVYAGGRFTSISDAPRQPLAALDGSSGAPTSWNPGADGHVSELLATPTGFIVGGDFNSLAATAHEGLGGFPPTG